MIKVLLKYGKATCKLQSSTVNHKDHLHVLYFKFQIYNIIIESYCHFNINCTVSVFFLLSQWILWWGSTENYWAFKTAKRKTNMTPNTRTIIIKHKNLVEIAWNKFFKMKSTYYGLFLCVNDIYFKVAKVRPSWWTRFAISVCV